MESHISVIFPPFLYLPLRLSSIFMYNILFHFLQSVSIVIIILETGEYDNLWAGYDSFQSGYSSLHIHFLLCVAYPAILVLIITLSSEGLHDVAFSV
jgi:hypothetical protein